jgi:hypothetical protein
VIQRTKESIEALGLTDGPIHAELRLTDEYGPVPLELAARSIGGLCGRILRYGAGLSLEEVIVAHALGRDPAELKRVSRPSGVMMLPVPREGTLQAVDNRGAALAVPGILDLQITVAPGTYVRPLPEGDRYLGFLFAQGDSAEDVRHALGDASAALDIRIA